MELAVKDKRTVYSVYSLVKRPEGEQSDYDLVCKRCGAAVRAQLTHSVWHAEMDAARESEAQS